MRDDEVVGRIGTCMNYVHNKYHEEEVGFFGFFECADDYEVASMLLKVAMITLKREGAEKMRGPMNFSTNHECGFLVEGFDTIPNIMMTYNQPYLPKLAEKFGLKKTMDLLALVVTEDDPISERFLKIVERVEKRSSFTVRSLNMSDFDNELDKIHEIYNKAWQYNWGFVPLDKDEFRYAAQNMKQIVDPEIVFIVENEGVPVAFSLALPNINQALKYLNGKLFPFGLIKLLWHTKIRNKINSARLVTFGVVPEFQKRGVDALLFVKTYQTGQKKGYAWAELSWILETNERMLDVAGEMGAKQIKKYRISEIPL